MLFIGVGMFRIRLAVQGLTGWENLGGLYLGEGVGRDQGQAVDPDLVNAVDGPVVLVTKSLHTLKTVKKQRHKMNTIILYKVKIKVQNPTITTLLISQEQSSS